MSKCAGCFAKFKRFEKNQTCPECKRVFCLLCVPGKKVVLDSSGQRVTEGRDVCVYCTREQKERMKKEEIEAVGNFHNRYYQNPHLSSNSTTVTKKTPTTVQPEVQVSVESDDIKKIEERLQRLKEPAGLHSHESPSEGDIKNRLENLRGLPGSNVSEGGIKSRLENLREAPSSPAAHVPGQQTPACAGTGASDTAATGKTETQEAQNLFEKVSEELDLDRKLAGALKQDGSDLPSSQQALTGHSATEASSGRSGSIGGDMKQLLDDMEVELPDEDPEKLLEELKGTMKGLTSYPSHASPMTPITSKAQATEDVSKKSCAGGTAASLCNDNSGTSNGGTDGVKGTGSVHGGDGVKGTGSVHGGDGVKGTGSVHRGDGVKGACGGLQGSSLDGDCTVREKPHLDKEGLLQFHWDHFGANPHVASTGRPGSRWPCADRGGDDGDVDDEVQQLIAQVLEETELECKMDSTGHGSIVEEWDRKSAAERASDCKLPVPGGASPSTGPPSGETSHATKPLSGGASAAMYMYSDFGKEDLPWCCICNDDATLRCFDCDGDLYCKRCFAEGHEQFGLYGHHVEAFKPPTQGQ